MYLFYYLRLTSSKNCRPRSAQPHQRFRQNFLHRLKISAQAASLSYRLRGDVNVLAACVHPRFFYEPSMTEDASIHSSDETGSSKKGGGLVLKRSSRRVKTGCLGAKHCQTQMQR